jgi:predicted nucleic acid-binding protein
MLLVDTTVWIDFFANRTTPHVIYLADAISRHEDVCLCGVILTEILQGISHPKQYQQTRAAMKSLVFLPMTHDTFISAADIYRNLRVKGITIRKTIDCMIAAVALENDIPLLHCDRDFAAIEKHCQLKVVIP